MNTSDYIGFSAVFAWGLWWVAWPGSVLRFYRWFHRGTTKLPGEKGVRIAGVLWLVLTISVLIAFLRNRA